MFEDSVIFKSIIERTDAPSLIGTLFIQTDAYEMMTLFVTSDRLIKTGLQNEIGTRLKPTG